MGQQLIQSELRKKSSPRPSVGLLKFEPSGSEGGAVDEKPKGLVLPNATCFGLVCNGKSD